jgi:hypothetical protein
MKSKTPSEQLAEGLVSSHIGMREPRSAQREHERFLAMKKSELDRGVKEYETQENLDRVILGYQLAEKRLFGSVDLLPGETDLTKDLAQTESRLARRS